MSKTMIWWGGKLPDLEAMTSGGAGSMNGWLGIEFIEAGDDWLRASMPVDRAHPPAVRAAAWRGIGGALPKPSVRSRPTPASIRAQVRRRSGMEINANHIRPAYDGFVHATARPEAVGPHHPCLVDPDRGRCRPAGLHIALHGRGDPAGTQVSEAPARSVAVVGAGDHIGAAIVRRFAAEGFAVHAGRRNGDKLAPLLGGAVTGRSLDARQSEDVAAFLDEAEAIAPLALVVFNVGANVQFPIAETTDRVFRKVWEMACFAGFATVREAARIMAPRGEGAIFVTGATAAMRGNPGYAAFAAAKAGLRAVAQSAARELWPQGLHVAHLVIDAGVDTAWVRARMAERLGEEAMAALPDDVLMPPEAVADAYWALFNQPRSAWTFEQEIRPYRETW
jgi:uncharacterized protein (TIGR00369 family)